MIDKYILLMTFSNEPELIFYSHLKGFKYFSPERLYISNINYLFAKFK